MENKQGAEKEKESWHTTHGSDFTLLIINISAKIVTTKINHIGRMGGKSKDVWSWGREW